MLADNPGRPRRSSDARRQPWAVEQLAKRAAVETPSYVMFMPSSLPSAKEELRQAALLSRKQITPADRQRQSELIFNRLAALPSFSAAHTVASYESWPSEPDTSAINQNLLANSKTILVPAGGRQPGWRYLTQRHLAQPGSAARSNQVLPPSCLVTADLILVPALAVDQSGTRLGRGAGWYDQMLTQANPSANIVALLFSGEFYRAKTLPRNPHDIPVDWVITPDETLKVPN